MKHKLQISTLIFLVCIMFNQAYSQQNLNGWYWVNGQPQSNPLNWVKIIDATHYYAVGDGGTFMKSSDDGDTWLINSQAGVPDPSFGAGATLRLYSAWFFDANTGILTGQSVANDGGKIQRTTDGGQTFTTIGLGIPPATTYMPPRVYDIYFINSTTGYICGDSVVKSFKTTDAGLNWTLLPNLPNLPSSYNCVYAKDENNIFLGVASDGYANQRRIVRTTNAGATWKIDTLPGASSYSYNDIEFQDANTGFITGTFNSSYFGYTTNGGANWTQAIFPTGGAYQLQIIGSTVYALSSNSYHYTTNLGVSWGSINTTDPANVNQPNGGTAAFDINGNDAIVVGGGGQINVSNDAGSTWRSKNYSVGNNSYCFSSVLALRGTSKVWAGAFGGGLILYSSDRGASWVKQQTSAGEAFEEIDMIDFNTGYAVGGSISPNYLIGYCYKTTNGGTNWVNLTIPNPTMKRYGLCFVDANTGWVFGGYPFGSSNQIIKTTDGGATWVDQLMTPSHDLTIEDGDFSDANTGYCTYSTNVYKTTNGGTNWNRIDNIPPALYWKKVQTFSNSTLYLGGGQTIYKSTNAGVNWNSVNIPSALPNIFNMDWTDLNNGIVVGTQGYTAKTTDGGITWTERNTGTSTLTGISMASKDTAFAACDRNVWGAILRLYDNDIINGVTQVLIGKPDNYSLSQNYPNPFNPSTNLGFGISDLGFVSLKVYNLLGNEVAILVNEIKPAGSYEVEFNGSTYASGIYFYRLEVNGNQIDTKRMILLK